MSDGETGDLQGPRPGGRFRPGESGNPKGRPLGSRNKTTELCAQLLGDDAEGVMKTLIAHARKGKGVALRLAVERLLPARASRDRCVSIELPRVQRAADLVGAAGEVISRAAAGEISLSEAKEFMALLEAERKTIETAELSVRLEALEARMQEPVGGGVGADPDMLARVRRVLVRHGEDDREVRR